MKNLIIIFFTLFFSLEFIVNAYSNPDIKKIDEQLDSVEKLFGSGVIDEETYNNSKNKLIDRKKEIQSSDESQSSTSQSKTLEKQLEVIEKLYKDGVISEDEFIKTSNFLKEKEASGENIDLNDISQKAIADYKLNVKKDIPGKKKWSWEPAELIYKDYKIETYRPGGIRVVRISDGKKLLQITDNYKVKFFNDGENIIKIEKTIYQVDRATNPDELVKNVEKSLSKSLSDIGDLVSDPIGTLFKKRKKLFLIKSLIN